MMIAVQVGLSLMILIGIGIIIATKNVVHAAYALAMTLLGVAGVYVLLQAELLAVVQILLYAGGVVILLSFGVMMSSRMKGDMILSGSRNVLVASVISVGLFLLLVYFISMSKFDGPSSQLQGNQLEQIGISFLTDHIVAFELIAFILLVALVGAAYLAKMSSNE